MDGIVEFNLKFKKERKREIKRELERIKKILPKLNIEKAILFGSSARGDIGIESDIDLIIIKNSKIPFMDRLKTFYKICLQEFQLIFLYILKKSLRR
ncbi:MAG: nucleotidyltransferase domain-containing protein [Caldisericia bacterium]|nr:nucleotidyltransferase domain-containing protein [Caldisericia bacterium]